MGSTDEMNAIRATWASQGVQETLPLAMAGYREASAMAPSYPYLPAGDDIDRARRHARKAGWVASQAWLQDMTSRNGHCGQ